MRMMRAGWIAVVMGCAVPVSPMPVTAPATSSGPPSRAGSASTSEMDGAHPRHATSCIVSQKETIIVLGFMGDMAPIDLLDHVTRAFRAEVESTPLPLSPYRGLLMDEILLAGCDINLLPEVFVDASCATGIASGLNADWLVLGTVERGSSYVVRSQLVRAGDMATSRSASFAIKGPESIASGAHHAWVELSARRP